MTIRAFTPADYEPWVAADRRCYPDYPYTAAELRHEDDTFDTSRFFKLRLVAEQDGVIVGGVQTAHRPSRFHPDRYHFGLFVVPEARRRGHGTALYDAAVAALRARDALAAGGGVKESMSDGVRFFDTRGWVEVRRDWESRLVVAGFDFTRFAAADERMKSAAIHVATLAEERRHDPDADRKAYALVDEVRKDVPATDPATPETFEEWRERWVDTPGFIPEAFFVAIDGAGRWLGVSNLERQLHDPRFVWQGLTGVRREARGRGIAMALKLRTVRYAQGMGALHIKTWNAQQNRPMLAINEALGFAKEPAWIALEKRFRE